MDKPHYLKQIIKHLVEILLSTMVVGLWFYLSKISIIPYADSIKEVHNRGQIGIFMLVVSIVLVICYVVVISISLYKIGLSIHELLNLTAISDTTCVATDAYANDIIEPFNPTSSLNEKIPAEVRNSIVKFYNDNKGTRNKGLLLACVIEYMCEKEWLNASEPGYQRLEEFFKNDLGLDSVGFQQLNKSHQELKDIIIAVKGFNEGKAQDPDKKSLIKFEQYKKFIVFINKNDIER